MKLPQTPLELIDGQLDWVHKNINNNLDFLPEDKLNWKPAPTSKSVLEIINHATGTVNMFTCAIAGTPKTDLPPATNRQDSKALITHVIEAHQKLVNSLTPEQCKETVKLPMGEMPKGVAVGLPVVELINHHGQLTYIETLLGDEESHLVFD